MAINKKMIPPPPPYMAPSNIGIPQAPAAQALPLESFDQSQGIIPPSYFGGQSMGQMPPPPAVSMGPQYASSPEPMPEYPSQQADNGYYSQMKATIDKLNDPSRQQKRDELQSKVLSLMANTNDADRRSAKATSVFGSVIAPLMGLVGGPAASAAAVQQTQVAQEQARILRQQQNQDNNNQVAMLKFLKDVDSTGDKEALSQVVQLQMMHGQQQRDEAAASRDIYRIRHEAWQREQQQHRDDQQQANRDAAAQRQANMFSFNAPVRDAKVQAAGDAHELAPLKQEKLKQDTTTMLDPTTGTQVSVKEFNARSGRIGATVQSDKAANAMDPNSPEGKKKAADLKNAELAAQQKEQKIAGEKAKQELLQSILGPGHKVGGVAQTGKVDSSAAPPQAVEFLKTHRTPELEAEFKAKYGFVPQ